MTKVAVFSRNTEIHPLLPSVCVSIFNIATVWLFIRPWHSCLIRANKRWWIEETLLNFFSPRYWVCAFYFVTICHHCNFFVVNFIVFHFPQHKMVSYFTWTKCVEFVVERHRRGAGSTSSSRKGPFESPQIGIWLRNSDVKCTQAVMCICSTCLSFLFEYWCF